MACDIRGISLNIEEQIMFEWKLLYQGNKKIFFLPGLVIVICKRVGMPLLDIDEVLPINSLSLPILIRKASTWE